MASFALQEEMKNFRVRVEELVKENEDLHEQLHKINCISPTEWQVTWLDITLKATHNFACCVQTLKITSLKEKGCFLQANQVLLKS